MSARTFFFAAWKKWRLPCIVWVLCGASWIADALPAPATRIWTGGGTTDNWTDPANWGGVAPLAADILKFGAAAHVTNFNNYAPGTAINLIEFQSAAPAMELRGNRILLVSSGSANSAILNSSNQTQTIGLDVEGQGTVYFDTPHDIVMSGVISGAAYGLLKEYSGMLDLRAANIYTGPTTLASGILRLSDPMALPGGIDVNGGTSKLTLSGVLELACGNFYRGLGTAPYQVQLTGGGFGARGADRVVNLGGQSQQVVWGQNGFNGANNALMLSSSTSDAMIDFQNPINLNPGTNGVLRGIVVADGTAAVDARLSSSITGKALLYKSGGGTLVLAAANSFTLGMQVDGGTVRLGAAGALPNGPVSVATGSTLDLNGFDSTIAAEVSGGYGYYPLNCMGTVALGGAALTIDNQQTVSLPGTITGLGRLVKANAGEVVLTGTNSYSGPTIITGGQLSLVKTAALPGGTDVTGGASNLSIGGGGMVGLGHDFFRSLGPGADQVQFTGSGGFGTTVAYGSYTNFWRRVNLGGASAQVVWGQGGFIPDGCALRFGGGAAYVVFQNPIDLGNAIRTINADVSTHYPHVLEGVLSGSGGLMKTGAGTLSITAANTYTGDTQIAAGMLRLDNTNALQRSTVNYDGTGGTLDFGYSISNPVLGGLKGSHNLSLVNDASSAVALTVGANDQSTAYSGVLSGAGSLVKNGTGTLTLTGANTYSGNTTVAAGAIEVDNTVGSGTGSGRITINSGATLSGSGLIAGPVTVAGTLAPGSGLGILTINNQVAFQPGSTFNAEVFGSEAGSGYDQLVTTGSAALAGSLQMTFGAFTPTGHDVLFLINNTGAETTSGAFQYPDNAVIGRFNGYDWRITYDANNGVSPGLNGGNDVAVYSVAVPEPGTFVLLATSLLGVLVCAWRKRR